MTNIDKKVTRSFYRHPVPWNVGILLAILTTIGGISAWYVANAINLHDANREAHRVTLEPIVKRLEAIEAKQIREEIYTLDSRLCTATNPRPVREKLAELFIEYLRITGEPFPKELLECV